MWEKDGFKLVCHKEVERDNHLWRLYAVYQPASTIDYGRHFGMLIVACKRTREIVAHDLTNQFDYSPSLGLESWFERHLQKGLGNVS